MYTATTSIVRGLLQIAGYFLWAFAAVAFALGPRRFAAGALALFGRLAASAPREDGSSDATTSGRMILPSVMT